MKTAVHIAVISLLSIFFQLLRLYMADKVIKVVSIKSETREIKFIGY